MDLHGLHNDINLIIHQAQLLLLEKIHNVSPTLPTLSLDKLETLWSLPVYATPSSHSFLTFVDLIKGVIPTKLVKFLLSLDLSYSQTIAIITKLLSFIRVSSWDYRCRPNAKI